VVLVRKAGDVADLDQQPGSAGGADVVQVNQGGSGRLDECGVSSLSAAFFRR